MADGSRCGCPTPACERQRWTVQSFAPVSFQTTCNEARWNLLHGLYLSSPQPTINLHLYELKRRINAANDDADKAIEEVKQLEDLYEEMLYSAMWLADPSLDVDVALDIILRMTDEYVDLRGFEGEYRSIVYDSLSDMAAATQAIYGVKQGNLLPAISLAAQKAGEAYFLLRTGLIQIKQYYQGRTFERRWNTYDGADAVHEYWFNNCGSPYAVASALGMEEYTAKCDWDDVPCILRAYVDEKYKPSGVLFDDEMGESVIFTSEDLVHDRYVAVREGDFDHEWPGPLWAYGQP